MASYQEFFNTGSFEKGYNINNNFIEIMAGTSSITTPMYKEAAEDVENAGNKSLASLKKFIVAIEEVDSKVKDSRISASKGNVKSFSGYKNIEFCLNFMSKNLSGLPLASELKKLHDLLVKYQAQYTEGYEKKVRLVVLEYESALYMLVTGIAMVLSTNMEVVQNGTSIKFQKKEGSTGGVISKTVKDLVKQIDSSTHKQYLDELLKAVDYKRVKPVEESTEYYTEGLVVASFELIGAILGNVGKIAHYTKSLANTVIRSVFGIVPLIRSIIYMRYKRKADTVLALEQQARFIEQNITTLKNNERMDPKKKEQIIKKQQAQVEAYMKKAEKLRAELSVTEKDTSASVQSMNKDVHEKKNDTDDFVLESVGLLLEKTSVSESVADFFNEAAFGFRKPPKAAFMKNYKKTSRAAKSTEKRFVKEVKGRTLSKSSFKLNNNPVTQEQIDKTEKAALKMKKETARKSIRLIPGKKYIIDTKRTATKIGGTPYWPKNMDYPKCSNGDLIMLAQLNFSDLPALEGFPRSGIMQFFVYDAEYENIGNKSQTKVIYHKDIAPESEWYEVDKKNTTCGTSLWDNYFPIQGVYYPTAKLEEQGMTPAMEEWDSTMIKYINQALGTNYQKYWDIPNGIHSAFYKVYKDYDGCRIGGYPYFTQCDPRNDDSTDVLLVQLDSEAGMMWGDVGIANFFTSTSALKNLDFDNKVLFTWDCG